MHTNHSAYFQYSDSPNFKSVTLRGIHFHKYCLSVVRLIAKRIVNLSAEDTRKIFREANIYSFKKLKKSQATHMKRHGGHECTVELTTECLPTVFGENDKELEPMNISPNDCFRKEAICEAKGLDMLQRIHNQFNSENNHQAKKDQGLMRIALDVPETKASKRYFYVICEARHSRGHVCDLSRFIVDSLCSKDQSLYEVIRDRPRRQYLDVEWISNENEGNGKLIALLTLYKKFNRENDNPANYKISIISGCRQKDSKYKNSYHIVFENMFFRNKEEHASHMKHFRQWLVEHEKLTGDNMVSEISHIANHKKYTKAVFVFSYDHAVYTTNRLMRLLGQSKIQVDDAGNKRSTPFVKYVPGEPLPFEVVPEIYTISVFNAKEYCDVKTKEPLTMYNMWGLTRKHVADYDRHDKAYKQQSIRETFHDDPEKFGKKLFNVQEEIPVNFVRRKTWKDVNAKELRSHDYNDYLRFLTAVLATHSNITDDELIEWTEHSSESRAVILMLSAKNSIRPELMGCYKKLMCQYGLLDHSPIPSANKALEVFFKRDACNKYIRELKNESEYEEAPEFTVFSQEHILQHLSATYDDITLLSGCMGSGKTYCVIEHIVNKMSKGSLVTYIVPRVSLAIEIASKFKGRENINVFRGQIAFPSPTQINIEIVVINSVTKLSDRHSDLVIIDELNTTLGNFKMDNFNTAATCTRLYSKILDKRSNVIIMEAMYSLNAINFVRAINMEQGEGIEKPIPVEFRLKKIQAIGLNFDQINLRRTIIEVEYDMYDLEYRRNGFITNMMHEVIYCNNNIAIACGNKKTATKLKHILESENKTVMLCAFGRKYDLNKVGKYNVFIYTSCVTAGISIDIKNHFDSVFVMFPSLGADGEWKSPPIDHMMQMTGRVRNPITNKMYVCVEPRLGKVKDIKPFKWLTNNIPIDVHQGQEYTFRSLVHDMTALEYHTLVVLWLKEYAYPGSSVAQQHFVSSTNRLPDLANIKHKLALDQAKLRDKYQKQRYVTFASTLASRVLREKIGIGFNYYKESIQ